MYSSLYEEAQSRDAKNPLGRFRQQFVIGDPELIYLDGNSLGRLSLLAKEALMQAIEEDWGKGLVRSWQKWLPQPTRLGDKIAQIIGAAPGTVAVCDSTSVNLYKLAVAALSLRPARTEILTDTPNFPSDIYLLEGIVKQNPNLKLRVVEDPLAEVGENTALVLLSHVHFKSGFKFDMVAATEIVQEAGAIMLWDLSHSVGAVQVELEKSGAEFAVGCTYKYLNGGPGSPAFLYVRKDLLSQVESPILGWFGHSRAFDFTTQYQPAEGIERFLAGTPPILSTIAMEATLDMLIEVGMNQIEEVSRQMTEYACEFWRARLSELGVGLASPPNPQERGSHISFSHPNALAIDLALIQEQKVIPDFRTPDNVRFGFTPLYTTFVEIHDGLERMAKVVESGAYLKYLDQVPNVT